MRSYLFSCSVKPEKYKDSRIAGTWTIATSVTKSLKRAIDIEKASFRIHFIPLGSNTFTKLFCDWFNIYTLLLFGGLHPLCGNGVTSYIEVTCNPAEDKALIADSLPAPGPLTLTETVVIPILTTSLATFSDATVAA